jgi:ribosomal protein L40E
LSGLTKKTVYADKLLSAILGVSEGELVSYAQISQGVHKYIKDNDLKNLSIERQHAAEEKPLVEPSPTSSKQCRDCGAEIPYEAAFCDVCGVSQ